MTAEVGDKAPDFTLRSQTGDEVTLSQYLGKKWVVLQTHVLSFTGG
ncbi:MAG: AhpC-TSA protein [Dehalococcoidia bacterium]|nr:AhpC-TSA protein [Dehalococcoidia bacterium]